MKKILVLLILVLAAGTIGCAGLGQPTAPSSPNSPSNPTNTSPQNNPNSGNPQNPANQPTDSTNTTGNNSTSSGNKGTLTSVDDQWNLYANSQLGFSIKVPKQVVSNSTSSNGQQLEPIQVLEDQDTVYITSPSDFNAEKIKANLAQTSMSGVEKLHNQAMTWAILVEPAADEAAVTKFIKDRYGASCGLGEIKDDSRGFKQVNVKGSDTDKEDFSCWMYFAYVIYYDPQKKILANWDLGQALRFELKPGDLANMTDAKTQAADAIMQESFKFL
jgi:hypothetical protein